MSPNRSEIDPLLLPYSQQSIGMDPRDVALIAPAVGARQDSNPGNLPIPVAAQGQSKAGEEKATRRSTACINCRSLRQKCVPVANDPNGDCQRCVKGNKTCTFPDGPRKKKISTTKTQLEQTMSSLASEVSVLRAMINNQHPQNQYEQVTNNGFAYQPVSRGYMLSTDPGPMASGSSGFAKQSNGRAPMVMAGQKRKFDGSEPTESRSFGNVEETRPSEQYPYMADLAIEYEDIIDRGIISAEQCDQLYSWYVGHMAVHLPAIIFPPGTTAAYIRKKSPTLFMAIMAASSSALYPGLYKQFTKELMHIFASRIICKGEKTMELVQALLISTLWYWPPEHYEDLQLYQLIHIAAVMAIDIGLGSNTKSSRPLNGSGIWKDKAWRRAPFPDAESIEARRTWLACYFLCGSAAMGLGRDHLIRWTDFIAESVSLLENSSEAYSSDKLLAQWVRSQRLAEQVGTDSKSRDSTNKGDLADIYVQQKLNALEEDLKEWDGQVPPYLKTLPLEMTSHVMDVFIHESAISIDALRRISGQDSTEEAADANSDTLTGDHIRAIFTCIDSIKRALNSFLGLGMGVIESLPTFNFVRLAYVFVVLLNIYFVVATPDSELGKIIDKNELQIEAYLDRLLSLFDTVAAEARSRTTARFHMVFMMFRSYITHRDSSGKSTYSSINRQAPQRMEHPHEITPLHLLSEVATSTNAMPFSTYGDAAEGASFQFDMDVRFGMGEGFDKAMEMVFGDSLDAEFGGHMNYPGVDGDRSEGY